VDKPEVETSLLTPASAAVGWIRPLLGESILPDNPRRAFLTRHRLRREGSPLDQVSSPRRHVREREFETGSLA
jgi:hypothetical protein